MAFDDFGLVPPDHPRLCGGDPSGFRFVFPIRMIDISTIYFSGYFRPLVVYVCTARKGGVQMPEEKMVSEWAVEWLEMQLSRSLSENTESSYRQWSYQRFVPGFSSVALKKLTKEQVQEFYESLAHEGLSSNSIWCGHLILRRILAEAGREGLLETNPASEFKLSYQAVQEPKIIRRGQVKRYLEEAEKLGAYPILYMILTSGLRQGEAISLLWAAFDVDAQRICLQRRWIHLTPKQVCVLYTERQKNPKSSVVFLDSRTSMPYTEHRLYYLHRKALEQARLPEISLRQLQACAKEMSL